MLTKVAPSPASEPRLLVIRGLTAAGGQDAEGGGALGSRFKRKCRKLERRAGSILCHSYEYIIITVRGQRDGRHIPTSSPAR